MTSIVKDILDYLFCQLLVDQGTIVEFVDDTSSTLEIYAGVEEISNDYSLVAVLYYYCLKSEFFVVTFDIMRSVKK